MRRNEITTAGMLKAVVTVATIWIALAVILVATSGCGELGGGGDGGEVVIVVEWPEGPFESPIEPLCERPPCQILVHREDPQFNTMADPESRLYKFDIAPLTDAHIPLDDVLVWDYEFYLSDQAFELNWDAGDGRPIRVVCRDLYVQHWEDMEAHGLLTAVPPDQWPWATVCEGLRYHQYGRLVEQGGVGVGVEIDLPVPEPDDLNND